MHHPKGDAQTLGLSGSGENENKDEINSANQIDRKFETLASFSLDGAEETVDPDGRKCVRKVMMVEETKYDEVLTCDHSYDNRSLFVFHLVQFASSLCCFRSICFVNNTH